MLWRGMTLPPMSVASSSRGSCSTCWLMVAGRDVVPRCAWSFCELIGRKKALEVSDGTWLPLVRVRLRALPSFGFVQVSRFVEIPELRLLCEASVAGGFKYAVVLSVSVRGAILLMSGFGRSVLSPSSTLSREDMTLGDLRPSGRGLGLGKPPSSPAVTGRPEAIMSFYSSRSRCAITCLPSSK